MNNKFIKFIIALFVILTGMLSLQTQSVCASDSSFWVEYIDVGQGDAALVQCDGHYMLIDGGPADASSVIYAILKKNKIQSLDYMIATHPDADHIGGLSGVLNYASVDYCFCPVTVYDTETFDSLLKYLAKHGQSVTVPHAGAKLSLGSASVELLGPIRMSSESNNNSIITKVTYGSNSFLFMGDAETEEEQAVIFAGKNLKCDVLKVGHHGSRSSTSQSLIKNAKPKYAVISVGDNLYGHPTSAVLNRLYNSGVQIYRTDMQGDIVCTSDGNNITFSTEKNVADDKLWISGDNKTTSGQKAYSNMQSQVVSSENSVSSEVTYVLNTNSKKFHLPTCSSVSDMSPKNRQDVSASRDELISRGYSPCKRCNP